MYFFILLLLVVTTIAQNPPLCEPCSCSDSSNNKYIVTCTTNVQNLIFNSSYWIKEDNTTYAYKQLTIRNSPLVTLKNQFPISNITYLNLANNSIFEIGENVFSNLQDMVTLILSYNNIEILHPDAFEGQYLEGDYMPLKSLLNLHLDHNRIHSLDQDLFKHTSRVEFLSLSHNPFTVIDHQTLVAITSLVYLKKLDISYAQLKTLPDYFLHTPKFLSFLDLSGNEFEEIPKTLGDSHNLTILYFNNNLIKNLNSSNSFPEIATLKALHFSSNRFLRNISKGALSKLYSLEEFYCFENPELVYIDAKALSERRNGAEYETWPPIKKLYLQDNKLAYIDMQLVLNWKDLTELDLTNNPWTCECENQWIVDELMPIYLKLDKDKAKALQCAAPIEMVAYTLYDIFESEKTMRCLDLYGHRPERDGALLVGILAGVLITIPLILFIIYAYQRNWFGLFDSSPASFSRQFYKRTVSDDGYF